MSAVKGFKILIVDDATVNRYLLKMFVKKCISIPVTIDEATNGLNAIEMNSDQQYDLIFMDIKMPVMNGIEASERILQEYPNTVIVGTTGQVEDDVMKKCKKVGLKDCIGKPLSYVLIKRVIEKYVN